MTTALLIVVTCRHRKSRMDKPFLSLSDGMTAMTAVFSFELEERDLSVIRTVFSICGIATRRRSPYSVGVSGRYALTSCGDSSSPQRPRWLCSLTTVKRERCRAHFATRPFPKKQGPFGNPIIGARRGPRFLRPRNDSLIPHPRFLIPSTYISSA